MVRRFVLGGLLAVAWMADAAVRFEADWSRVKPYASAADKAKGAPAADFSSKVEDGVLTVSVRSLDNAVVKARVDFPKRDFPYAGKYMTLQAIVSGSGVASCGGLLQGQIDRTHEGKGKKHYWKPSTLPVVAAPAVWRKTRRLDPHLGELTFTFEMKEPGTYRFHELALFKAPDPLSAYEPGRNYLANGGAEQGHYATSAVGERAVRFGTKGGTIEPMKGKVYAGMLKPSVSETVARSGCRSFELTLPDNYDGRFYFAPVPAVDDRAFVFSFWVKASERRWFKAGLFGSSGNAYEQAFPATTEWTKVALRVPRWGEEGADGLRFYGKVTGAGSVVPYVEPGTRATFWIDDAFATVGTTEGEADEPPLAVTAVRATHPNGVYRPGEQVTGTVCVRTNGGVDESLRLVRRLYDWRNRELACVRLEASVRTGELPFAFLPPKGYRGPLTAEWTLTDAQGRLSRATQYFGVQPACGRLEKRLSVNVMFGSPEQSLAIMREFGIGGARLWGPCRNWDLDFGYAYTKLFHTAGIRNLFVLGSPHLACDGKTLRGEALLPVDPTEWFARQAALIDAHRGEVDVYEFLNEYNIWKGRLRSPDPTRFAEPTLEKYIASVAAFRPLLKAHDPAALLAGCATCSTDLAFIGAFLAQGGGDHVDMITEHAYSGNPDCPDYALKLEVGLAQARAAGVGKWAQTEAGATSPNHLTAGRIHPAALDQLSNDLRNMLIAWAKGLDHFSHFQLTTGRAGTDWNLTYLGNGDNDFEDLPKPALFAFRAAADFLADAPCTAEAKLSGGYKGYVFDCGARRVAAVWKWNGGTAALKPAAALSDAAWLDAMGNRLKPESLELSAYPVYCVSRLPASELARALEASARTATAGAEEAADASDPNLLFLPHGGATP